MYQPGELFQNDIRAAVFGFEIVSQAIQSGIEAIDPVVNLVLQVQTGAIYLVQGCCQEVVLIGLDGT